MKRIVIIIAGVLLFAPLTLAGEDDDDAFHERVVPFCSRFPNGGCVASGECPTVVASRECSMWPEIGLRTWTISCPCPVRKRRCRGGPGGKAQSRPLTFMEAGKSGSGGQPGVQSWHRRAAGPQFC